MYNTVQISSIKRFFNLLKVNKQEIFSIYAYALFNGLITLSLPLGIQAIINFISGGQISTSWIILVVFVITGVALTGIMQIMQLTISENLQQKIFTNSAFEFAYRIPKMKLEAVDKYYIPELVNRFFDTLSIQKGLSKILMDFSSASLQVILGLILLSLYHPFFILFSTLLVAIVYLIFKFTAPQGLKTSLTESKYKYEVAHWLEEIARAMETFKLAGNSPLPMATTDTAVQGYLVSRKAHFKTLLTQYINLVVFKVIVAAGLLLIGGLLVINQQMNIGQFVASEIIIILVLSSVEKLILSMETIYDVLTAIEKIGAVTDIPLEEDTGAKFPDNAESGISIKLNQLSYRFRNAKEDTLKNLQLNIESGEKICLAGFNGSGKSMLLQTVAGLYEGYSGAVLHNDIPLGNWCKADLRSQMGDNLAKEDIFRGTFLENISLGKPEISIKHVRKASEIVGLNHYIDSLPMGFNTSLLPEGKNLPRSIRLRTILARALVGNPKIILLEDTFNQLNKADKNSFLDHLLKGKWTVIAVSNDPSVAQQFNKTVVMDQGKIIANGTLQTMENEPWFQKVFQTK